MWQRYAGMIVFCAGGLILLAVLLTVAWAAFFAAAELTAMKVFAVLSWGLIGVACLFGGPHLED